MYYDSFTNNYFPVDPNPFSPLIVAEWDWTSQISSKVLILVKISCAILSPFLIQ